MISNKLSLQPWRSKISYSLKYPLHVYTFASIFIKNYHLVKMMDFLINLHYKLLYFYSLYIHFYILFFWLFFISIFFIYSFFSFISIFQTVKFIQNYDTQRKNIFYPKNNIVDKCLGFEEILLQKKVSN